ncbi:hypothetical protein LWI29_001144 [Acer saccharum]|uniref:Uncharacterized protein n=1 Tax=Acer saccharum TaxID=4024 RepID=A0AA39SJ47_ACESA|nr:hypothetical protein LWI29_001144 [Acer saccharum]
MTEEKKKKKKKKKKERRRNRIRNALDVCACTDDKLSGNSETAHWMLDIASLETKNCSTMILKTDDHYYFVFKMHLILDIAYTGVGDDGTDAVEHASGERHGGLSRKLIKFY